MQFELIPSTFLMLCTGQKVIKGNKKVSKIKLSFLYTALPLNVLYFQFYEVSTKSLEIVLLRTKSVVDGQTHREPAISFLQGLNIAFTFNVLYQCV